MNSYSLNDDNKQTEQQVIEQIVASNDHDTSIIKHFNKPGPKENNKILQISGSNLPTLGRRQEPSPNFLRKHTINTINKRLAPKPCNTNP
jgi:hypothetical protein